MDFYGKYSGILGGGGGTTGDLTDAGTDGIVITNGAGAVNGTGTQIAQHVADTSHNGYLSSADWNIFNTGATGAVTTVGAFGSTPNADGASISGNTLTLQPADGTHPGGISIATQTLAGAKTFSSFLSVTGGSGANPSFSVPTGGGNAGFWFDPAAGGEFVYNTSAVANFTASVWRNTVPFQLFVNTAAATPGIWFINDGTTGIYRPGSNQIGISASGAAVAIFSSSGADITGLLTSSNGLQVTGTTRLDTGLTGLLKASSGTVSVATAGTDYQAPISLAAFGSTPNADGLSFSSNILTLQPFDGTHPGGVPASGGGTTNFLRADGSWAVAGSGTVTAVSVVSTNGFAGTSSGGATPALTLSTTITGILQGNGTAISAATTTGSGSVVLATAPTMSSPVVGTQTQGDSSTKAASTAYVDTAIANAVAGINPAIAVQAATTAAGDTSALTYNNGASGIGATFTGANNTALIIDGFTFTAVGQRLLVKNDTQSPSGAFNGIYNVTQIQTSILPPILTRALDYDTPSDMNNTGAIPVINGTANGTTSWVLSSQVVTVGTTPLTFTQFTKNPAAYLLVANNLSDVATKATAFNNVSPLTTKGDIVAFSTTNARLPVGTDTFVLTADSTQTLGVKWAAASGSSSTTSTQWASYTPTLSASFGTTSGITFFWRRVGDTMEVRGAFTNGVCTAALGTITLPSSLVIDTSKMVINSTTSTQGQIIGNIYANGANEFAPLIASTTTSTSLIYVGGLYNAGSFPIPKNLSSVLDNNALIQLTFEVPISGWTNNN